MGRRVALVAVLVVAVCLGVLLGPVVLDGSPSESATTPSSTPSTPSTSEEPPSPSVTYATEGPSTPAPEPGEPSEAEQADLDAGVRGQHVPDTGSGELRVVSGSSDPPDSGAPVTTVRVEVEEGLDIDDAAFARFVMETLNDPRSWGADGSVRFARTDGEADIRVVLATPGTVDTMCAPLATNGRWSCGRNGHAALNADRWVFGADAFAEGGGDLTFYRRYLVNHEVGHLLGHPHESCPVPGEPAPVMVQQSIDLDGCAPNGWPFP